MSRVPEAGPIRVTYKDRAVREPCCRRPLTDLLGGIKGSR